MSSSTPLGVNPFEPVEGLLEKLINKEYDAIVFNLMRAHSSVVRARRL